jgi:thiol-disulfide isomerase/thioredoxin
LRGEEVTLESLRGRGKPVVLVFVHPRCGPCRQLLPDLAQWQTALAHTLTIAVLSEGSVAANRPLAEGNSIDNFLLQEEREVYLSFDVRAGTPAAVVVDPDGTIAGATVGGRLRVEELIRLTLSRSESRGEPTLAR